MALVEFAIGLVLIGILVLAFVALCAVIEYVPCIRKAADWLIRKITES